MTTHSRTILRCFTGLLLAGAISSTLLAEDAPKQPRIVGDWWQVAGNPDLGELTGEKQQPVDFGVWRAADGTWQLWSCIRYTKEPKASRVFYRWESAKLTDANWKPMGIAMHADPKFGETAGGLQAPYVFQHDGLYWMFYGDWANICSATSKDGKVFERRVLENGKTGLFSDSPGLTSNDPAIIKSGANNTRDPMVIRIGNLWYCYYTARPDHARIRCRTSPDLLTWSEAHLVANGANECPFVVEPEPGCFTFSAPLLTELPISKPPSEPSWLSPAIPRISATMIKRKPIWSARCRWRRRRSSNTKANTTSPH